MTIQEIYEEQKPFVEIEIAKMYNKFVKDIENDDRYTLSDDELTEIFNEVVLMYMRDTMHKYEWIRITKLLKK